MSCKQESIYYTSDNNGAGTSHTFEVNVRWPVAYNVRCGSFAATMKSWIIARARANWGGIEVMEVGW